MPVNVPLKRVIQTLIISLAVFAVLLVWPLNIWCSYFYEGAVYPDSIEIVQPEGPISQTFVPSTENMSYISFYIYNEDAEFLDGQLIFRVFDGAGELENKVYDIEDLNIPGLCRVPIKRELSAGAAYYFMIESPDAELLYAMEDGINYDIQYAYKEDHLTWQGVKRIALILIIAAGLCLLAEFLFRNVQGRRYRYDLGFRSAVGLVLSGICLWFLWNVFPAKRFTTDPLNIVVLAAGILLFAVYSLYGLFHKRKELPEIVIPWKQIAGKVPGLLQTVAFAGVMAGCVNYLNALNMVEQKTASNLVYCCFALAIICSFTKKELFNWYNIVYAVIAVPVGILYCFPYREDLEQFSIYKGNAWCVALWGIILCNIIRLLILDRKNRNQISVAYAAAVVLLIASWIFHRNERTWPIEAALFFGLFAMRLLLKGERTSYLSCFRDGIFLHFVWISGYAVLYRPFHFFIYVRYGSVFHTVTAAAVYNCMVMVIAVGNFLVKYAKGKSPSCLWKEIGLIGLASGFLFLTASRTGLYTAIVLILLLLIITTFTEYQDKLAGLLKRMGILCLTGAVFVVIVFSACRMVPAVVNKPYTYEIEWFPDSIKAGEPWDSFRFITVQKFLAVFDARFSYYVDTVSESAGNTDSGVQQSGTGGNYLTDTEAGLGGSTDFSNGRADIYRQFFKALDFNGHVSTGMDGEDGKYIHHAHNVFLQTAYDFGIIPGILFLLFCFFAGIKSVLYYFKHKDEVTAILPVLFLSVYGICGLVEWVYLPFIPTGFAFFLIIAIMIPKEEKRQED